MLEFIQEQETIWEYLQQATKPIVLYGMGNGADRILDKCLADKIPVVGVFASDGFVRGQTFRSYPVRTYAQTIEEFPDPIILIAFAAERNPMLGHFYELATKHEVYAPNLALFHGDELVDQQWLTRYEQQLREVYEHLADDKSRDVFAQILNYKLSGKLEYLQASTTQRLTDLQTLFKFGQEETYVDLGAYNGDTVEEFLELTHNQYARIFALEPDKKNFKKLEQYQVEHPELALHCLPQGIWKEEGTINFFQRGGRMSSLGAEGKAQVEVTTIDALQKQAESLGTNISYIKMDVEGAEQEALVGGTWCLQEQKPKLFVAGYHRDNDLWQIPLLLWSLQPEYRIYLRRHPYIPCWEINFLATV